MRCRGDAAISCRYGIFQAVTIRELASELREVHEDNLGVRLRLVRQFVMSTYQLQDPASPILEAPESSGSKRWDTFLRALGEYVSQLHGLRVPAWTAEGSALDEWWLLMPFPELHGMVLARTPPAFAIRGIFVQRSSLVNA